MNTLISRIRYTITRKNRNNETEYFCGGRQSHEFRTIKEMNNISLQTYPTANRAKASFLRSWYDSEEEDFINGKYQIIEVKEQLIEIGEVKL